MTHVRIRVTLSREVAGGRFHGRPFILGKPSRYPYSEGGTFRLWTVTVFMEDTDGFRYAVPAVMTDGEVFEPLPARL